MSTKVYTAYRVPVSKLNTFLYKSKSNSINQAAIRIQELITNMRPEAFYNILIKTYKDDAYVKQIYNNGDPTRMTKFDAVIACCKEASHSSYRDPMFNIDCGWTVRIYDDHAYLIQYGEMYMHGGFKTPGYAKDFSYWDNTDKPFKITNKSWENRGILWHKLFNLPELTFFSIDLKYDSYITISDIMRKSDMGFFK